MVVFAYTDIQYTVANGNNEIDVSGMFTTTVPTYSITFDDGLGGITINGANGKVDLDTVSPAKLYKVTV